MTWQAIGPSIEDGEVRGVPSTVAVTMLSMDAVVHPGAVSAARIRGAVDTFRGDMTELTLG